MAVGVMLVEDDAGVRTLLKKIIERNEGFEVNGECDNLADAVTLFVRNRPEVIFMDIEINGVNGIDCARVIMDMEPKTKIIFATAHADRGVAERLRWLLADPDGGGIYAGGL